MLRSIEFPHTPPIGYSYETKQFKSNVVSIWLHHHYEYVYSSGLVSTIWGFYNTKKRCYFAPITSTRQGDIVDISETTPYTAMVPNYNPLEALLYSRED